MFRAESVFEGILRQSTKGIGHEGGERKTKKDTVLPHILFPNISDMYFFMNIEFKLWKLYVE